MFLRRIAVTSVACAGVLAAWATSALAYIQVPGGTMGDTGASATLPLAGTCTDSSGNPLGEVTSTLVGLGYPSLHFNGVDNVFTLNYRLIIACSGGATLIRDFVVPGDGTYAFDDTAGTLTVQLAVPASFTAPVDGGDSDFPATVTLTSGAGTYPVIYGADDATERKALVSCHRAVDRAAAQNEQLKRATALNQIILDIED